MTSGPQRLIDDLADRIKVDFEVVRSIIPRDLKWVH